MRFSAKILPIVGFCPSSGVGTPVWEILDQQLERYIITQMDHQNAFNELQCNKYKRISCEELFSLWFSTRLKKNFILGYEPSKAVADLRGVRGTPPTGAQILSISCSFWENMAKSYVGAHPGELAPPLRGKSRIRHCKGLQHSSFPRSYHVCNIGIFVQLLTKMIQK